MTPYVRYFINYDAWYVCVDNGMHAERLSGPYHSQEEAERSLAHKK